MGKISTKNNFTPFTLYKKDTSFVKDFVSTLSHGSWLLSPGGTLGVKIEKFDTSYIPDDVSSYILSNNNHHTFVFDRNGLYHLTQTPGQSVCRIIVRSKCEIELDILYAESGATVFMVYLEADSKLVAHTTSTVGSHVFRWEIIETEDNASVIWDDKGSTKKDVSVSKTFIFLNGDDSSCMYGSGRISSDEGYSLAHAEVVHTGMRTHSMMRMRAVVGSKSVGVANGLIIMKPSCLDSIARLDSKVVLFASDARGYAVPRLDVACNQVQASHAATVAPIEAEHLFYAMTRGLTMLDARNLIARSFLTESRDQSIPPSHQISDYFDLLLQDI